MTQVLKKGGVMDWDQFWSEAKKEAQIKIGKELLREKTQYENNMFFMLQIDKKDLVLLKTEDIAEIFQMSISAIRTRLVRNPDSLPRPFSFPRSRQLYWRGQDVLAFIEKHAQQQQKPIFDIEDILKHKRKKKAV